MPELHEPGPGPKQPTIVLGEHANAHLVPAGDDGSAGPVEPGFPVNFFGTLYTALYINTNGNISFREPLYKYLPFGMGVRTPPLIAPFLADVDTRAKTSGLVRYGTVGFEGRPAFCVNWIHVGYHAEHTDKLNRFQLLLVDRNDVGLGDFDIVLNYERLEWESGAASRGSEGLGGYSAAVGFSAGTGERGSFHEFEGSRTAGALLNGNTQTGLIYKSRGSPLPGRYIFRVRRGWPDLPRPAGRGLKYVPTAVKLSDGQVLALGDNTRLVDVFDPVKDTWRPTGDLLAERRLHTATLLTDGRVLVTGGEASPSTVELYDPKSGTWTPAAPMSVGRIEHTATLLKDGRVLVAGGRDPTNKWLASAEVYTPSTEGPGTWAPTGSLLTARSTHTATRLEDGRVLVTGGIPAPPTQKLQGETGGGGVPAPALASAEVYDNGTWAEVTGMNGARHGHTATRLNDGQVLVAGGNPTLDLGRSSEVFNLEGWTVTGPMGQSSHYQTATLLKTGHVLVTGGEHPSGYSNRVELYAPDTRTWSQVLPMAAVRHRHAAVLLNDGRLLIVGGFSHKNEGTYELYYPPFYRRR